VRAASASEVNQWIDRAMSDRSGAWDWPTLRAAAILHTGAWYHDLLNGRSDTAAHQLEAAFRLVVRVRDVERRQIEFIDRWRTVTSRRSGVLPLGQPAGG
jgi:hypothetical protein